MASISVSFDSKSSTVPASVTDPSSPHFDDEEEFYDYLRGTEAMDDDKLRFFGTCEKQIFDDFGNQNNIYFPPFENTKPIVSAHKKIWRAGHTRDISKLLLGTEDEKVSYVSGLLVTAITLFVCFLIWMIVLIVLKILGRDKVGFLSGHRSKLPLKQEGPSLDSKSKEETKPETAAGGGDEGGKDDEGEKDDADKATSNDDSGTINKTDESFYG